MYGTEEPCRHSGYRLVFRIASKETLLLVACHQLREEHLCPSCPSLESRYEYRAGAVGIFQKALLPLHSETSLNELVNGC